MVVNRSAQARRHPRLRWTDQRELIWDALLAVGPHCTVDDLTTYFSATGIRISRSTVYRSLQALTKAGSIYASALGTGRTHFEIAGTSHEHAICLLCHEITHIDESTVAPFLNGVHEASGLTPIRSEIVLWGVCRGCSSSRRHPPR